jgi:hypothetical protein
MERHFADTANVFVYYRSLKKVRSTPRITFMGAWHVRSMAYPLCN